MRKRNWYFKTDNFETLGFINKKNGVILVPIVFIGLGIYILIENGTIQTLLNFI